MSIAAVVPEGTNSWVDQNPLALPDRDEALDEVEHLSSSDRTMSPRAIRRRIQRRRARANNGQHEPLGHKPADMHRLTVVRILHEPATGTPEAHITRTRCQPAGDKRRKLLEKALARELKMELAEEPDPEPTRLHDPDDEFALAFHRGVHPSVDVTVFDGAVAAGPSVFLFSTTPVEAEILEIFEEKVAGLEPNGFHAVDSAPRHVARQRLTRPPEVDFDPSDHDQVYEAIR